MAFTVFSWNVEHFDGLTDARANDIAGFIQQHNPDLIAIYELEDSHSGFLFAHAHFQGFFTFITEGQNNQEILILANFRPVRPCYGYTAAQIPDRQSIPAPGRSGDPHTTGCAH